MGKISSFTDLIAWKEGHALVLMAYKVTKKFPREEVFGLTNQIRRAVVSVTSNVAEGFSRFSSNDKSRFYSMAQGSLTEVQNQLIIARDVEYLSAKEYADVADQTILVHKLINGLIKNSPNYDRS